MSTRVERVRSVLGPPPREVSAAWRAAFALPPCTVPRTHELARLWTEHEERLREGVVVQAHRLPLGSGRLVLVLTSFDRALERNPDGLPGIAFRVSELWRRTLGRPPDPTGRLPVPPPLPRDPEVRDFLEWLHLRDRAPCRVPVPADLTGGPLVELSEAIPPASHAGTPDGREVALALRTPDGTVGLVPPALIA